MRIGCATSRTTTVIKSNPFSRLSILIQISLLLSLDEVSDATDCWRSHSSSLKLQLAEGEVRAVLGLRDDFDSAAIKDIDLQ
jgi:deoxyribodipyrimidine photolyase-like uncharacterized protein